MSVKAGHLLIVRRRLELEDGITSIDTGLRQVNLDVEPPLGGADATADAAGIASRVMVAALAPLKPWVDADIHTSEPYLNVTTGTVWVDFWVAADAGPVEINVEFWDPHTVVTPMEADPYTTFSCVAPDYIDKSDEMGTDTVVVPTPATAGGQLLIAFLYATPQSDYADPSSDPVPADLSLWTLLPNSVAGIDLGGGTGLKFAAYYRVTEDVSPADYTFNMVGTFIGYAALVAVADFDSVMPIVDGPAVVEITPEDPLSITTPSLVPSGTCQLFASFHAAGFNFVTWSTPSDMVPIGQGGIAFLNPFTANLFTGFEVPTPTGTRTSELSFETVGIGYAIAVQGACGIFPDGASP